MQSGPLPTLHAGDDRVVDPRAGHIDGVRVYAGDWGTTPVGPQAKRVEDSQVPPGQLSSVDESEPH